MRRLEHTIDVLLDVTLNLAQRLQGLERGSTRLPHKAPEPHCVTELRGLRDEQGR